MRKPNLLTRGVILVLALCTLGGLSIAADFRDAAPVQIVGANPDGSTLPIPFQVGAGGALPVHETGYPSASQRCYDVTCSTVGDGGSMGVPPDGGVGSVLRAGARYVSTVTTKSAVRVRNGAACVGYAPPTGIGRILNEGSTLDFTAEAAPDGGVPFYTCCSEIAGGVWNLCEQ